METHEEKLREVNKQNNYGNGRALKAMEKADSPLELVALLIGV